jgi:hypothetical protein
MTIYKDEYWSIYDTVKEVLASRGIFDENIIHSKTKDIINKKNASHEAATSTSSRQTEGG